MTDGSTIGRLPGPASRPRLDRRGFAAHFADASHLLWLIAAGIVADRHLAEDIVQEAAVVGLRKLDTFDPDTNFNAWMGRIVRHVAMNHRRKRQRSRETGLDGAPIHAPAGHGAEREGVTPAGQLAAGHEAVFDDSVLAALTAVPETARACILLKTVKGLTYDEIADILGIPAGTAMSHVHRGRKIMRDRLTPERTPRPA